MRGPEPQPVIVPGDGWFARYRQESDDHEKPFSFDPILFFAVHTRPRSCRVIGYVADDDSGAFHPANKWSNFEGYTK